jgi:hypothetical protein
MKRPQQQIIDDAGERLMRSVFEPLGWAVRKQDKDNGIDFDIEIFENYKSTGVFFKVQLKSSRRTQYSASKEFISQPINTSNATYLCHEVRLPVVLIHADVSNNRIFWLAPQLIISKLQRQQNKESRKGISIRIPVINALPDTIDKLIETITKVEQVLASRLIISTPTSNFVSSVNQYVDEEQLLQEFQNKGDAIKLNRANDLFISGALDEARNITRRVLSNVDSSIRSKFVALLINEKIDWKEVIVTNAPQVRLSIVKLSYSDQLRKLTKKGPRNLKLYSIIAWEAAKLERLAHRYSGLSLNWAAHHQSSSSVWKAQLVFERTAAYRQIVSKYNQCIRLANYTTKYKYIIGIPQALMRIIEAMALFIVSLKNDKLDDLADKFSASTLEVCKLAASIALNTNDDDSLYAVATKALYTKRAVTGDAVDFAREVIERINDADIKCRAKEMFDYSMRAYRGEKVEGKIETTERQVYENMASSLGVDLNDSKDPISRVVKIGIDDLDPSRILVNCEHIFITLGPRGLVADILKMPTAGYKILHCDLHECAVEGLSLDGAYKLFKERFCDKCADSSPRPSSWKYSDVWQQGENVRHADYMKRFAMKRAVYLTDEE